LEVPVYDLSGAVVGKTELNETVFGQPFNEGLVHQAIVRYLANQRVGTASTLRRGEVSGGGKKPWRQKGTGRARQGSTRAPHWRGGGVVFGPHPRDYRQEMPVKMRRLALRCALSQRVRENGLRVLQELQVERPRTKTVAQILSSFGATQGALLVTPEVDRNVYLSARNLPGTATSFVDQLNIYDVMRHPVILMPLDAVRRLEQRLAATG
jgi:large subunit ribosomal protein L4